MEDPENSGIDGGDQTAGREQAESEEQLFSYLNFLVQGGYIL